ncbi:hypothetical protein D3C86_1141510 [compost metagenome]
MNQLCVDAGTAGIDDLEKALEFSLFPNPATSQITLSEVDFEYLIINDHFGRTVKIQNHSEGNTINLDDFADGIYQLSLVSGNNFRKQLFVVSK